MVNVLGPWRWLSARRPLDHLVNLNQTPSAIRSGTGPT